MAMMVVVAVPIDFVLPVFVMRVHSIDLLPLVQMAQKMKAFSIAVALPPLVLVLFVLALSIPLQYWLVAPFQRMLVVVVLVLFVEDPIHIAAVGIDHLYHLTQQ